MTLEELEPVWFGHEGAHLYPWHASDGEVHVIVPFRAPLYREDAEVIMAANIADARAALA